MLIIQTQQKRALGAVRATRPAPSRRAARGIKTRPWKDTCRKCTASKGRLYSSALLSSTSYTQHIDVCMRWGVRKAGLWLEEHPSSNILYHNGRRHVPWSSFSFIMRLRSSSWCHPNTGWTPLTWITFVYFSFITWLWVRFKWLRRARAINLFQAL